jgi:hypothetical protein
VRFGGLSPKRRHVFFLAVPIGLTLALALLSHEADAAVPLSATASVDGNLQYLGDTAGVVRSFTVQNTGTSARLSKIQIAAPTAAWRVPACPSAPAGWSKTHQTQKCVFRATSAGAYLAPGATLSGFKLKVTTVAGNADVTAPWRVTVTAAGTGATASATPSTPGSLDAIIRSYQLTRVVVTPSVPSPGTACPPPNTTAPSHSTRTIVVCGRNRTTATHLMMNSSELGGTFISGTGLFSSASIPPGGPASQPLVIGEWTATITDGAGTNKTVIANIRSDPARSSGAVEFGGFTATPTGPNAVNDSATVTEDSGANTVDVLANDTDPDAIGKSVASVTQPAHGGVTNNTTDVSYTPNANYCGADSFTYTLNGGSTATVAVTVSCVDDLPTAVDDTATVLESSGANTVGVLANDTDPDGGPKSIASVTQGTNGSVTNNSSDVSYTPNAGYCGADSFTYTLNGGSTATVSVTVTCVDDPPTAVNDSATVGEDSGANTVDVLNNDTDTDAGPKTVASVTQPTNGSVVNNTTDVSYTPDANYCGPDSFTYTLNGGSTATVSVTVTCVDDPPTAVNDSATVGESSTANLIDVLNNDTDTDGGPKSVASVTQGTNGSVTNNGTDVSYTPNASYCGPDSFTYTLNGGSTATVSITVTCINATPVAAAQSVNTDEDTPLLITLSGTDADDDNLTFSIVTTPSNGALGALSSPPDCTTTANTCTVTVTYTPTANYNGPDSFTFKVNDGTVFSAPATVSITVNSVNDAPVADDEAFSGTSRAVGNTSLVVDDPTDAAPDPAGPQKTVTGDILAGDTDADGDTLAVVGGTFATNDGGTVDLQPDGDFVFHPKAGTSCSDTSDFFDYTVTDQQAVAGTDTGRVTITIADCVWYVDSSAASGGNGTSVTPFNALSGINGAGGSGDADGPSAIVFLYDGTYSGGLPLEANQLLFGQRHGLTVPDGGAGSLVLEAAVPAGSPSTITGGLILSTNNTIQGIDLGDATGSALSGTSVGTAVMDTVTPGKIDNTTGGAVNIVTGTVNMAFTSVSSTNSATTGINLGSVAGTFTASGGALSNTTGTAAVLSGGNSTFTYDGTISNGVAGLVSIANETGGTKRFTGAITQSGSGGGIALTSNSTSTTTRFEGKLTLSTGGLNALVASNAGTLHVTDATSTLATTTGTALSVTGTTLGSTMAFRSISVTGNGTLPTNGVVVNNSGASAGLEILGSGGTCSSAATCTGGAIQDTGGAAIRLTNTVSPSFNNMYISGPDGSGVQGTGVTHFTFLNNVVTGAGNEASESAVAFNDSDSDPATASGRGVGNNLAGVVTIAGNTLTNAFYSGIDIQSDAGTISLANISTNTITNPGQYGVDVAGTGTATTVFGLTGGTISDNVITGSGFDGIQLVVGNGNATGPAGVAGVPNTTDKVLINGNTISLDDTAANAVAVATNGLNSAQRTQMNFTINNSGPITGSNTGTTVLIGNNGYSDMTGTISNNTIDASHTANLAGSNAIGGGNGAGSAGSASTPNLVLSVTNNTITNTDGNGILLVGRGATGNARYTVTGNTVAAPINVGGSIRQGIRVDAGSATSVDDAVCIAISGNNSAASNGGGGIGLRKQGTVAGTNDFGIVGIPQALPTNTEVQNYVNSQNPSAGSSLVVSGSAFVQCT